MNFYISIKRKLSLKKGVFESIKRRRSIRNYQSRPVDNKKVLRVLEAARLAPSATNRQPWSFIVVKNPKVKESLRSSYNKDWFISAPIIIVACANPDAAWVRKDGEKYWMVDVSIAMQNLVLTAQEEGLGTCWIGAFREEEAKKILGIPSNIRVVAMTPLGFPAEDKEAVTDRKPLEDIVHYNHW